MDPVSHPLHLALSYEPDRGFEGGSKDPLAHLFVATINGYEVFNMRLPCMKSFGKPDLERTVQVGEGLHKLLVIEPTTGHKVELTVEVRCETWVSLYAWGKPKSHQHPRFSYFLDARPPDFMSHEP